MKRLQTIGLFLLISVVIGLFCYFRIKNIYFQTVPYTFDQGRDFLKANEIIQDRNITLIGPTTGIQGVFHGAWWYYYLIVPYLLFQGHPSGFPLFTFLTFLAVSLFFFHFLKKNFNLISAFLFLTFCAVSPYLISISFFVISSFPILPLLLFLFYATYQVLKDKSSLWVFIIFLLLGSILEAEVPTGVFMIPAYLLAILATKNARVFWGTRNKILLSIGGLLLPMVPRFLFEIKNGFMQTKTLLHVLFETKQGEKMSILGALTDRLKLVWHYYIHLFPDENLILGILFATAGGVGVYLLFRKGKALEKKYLIFNLLFFVFIFLMSLLYRDKFWFNYLEGLSLFYVLFLSIAVYALFKNKRPFSLIAIGMCFLLLSSGLYSFYKDATSGKPRVGGMQEHVLAVQYIYSQVGRNNFCARIYTPPVIPHTYNYIFNYYARKGGLTSPDFRFLDQCWYIIEDDEYAFRIVDWRKENIPPQAKLVKKKRISGNVVIELWQRQ